MQRSGGPPDPGWGETSRYAAHLDRGWDHLDRGALDRARRSAEEARKIRPEDPDAAYLLGQIAVAAGRFEEAVEWFAEATKADPAYVAPRTAAAMVYMYDLGAPEEALSVCEAGLHLETLSSLDALDLHLIAADAEIALGKTGQAMDRLAELPEFEVLIAGLKWAARHPEAPPAPPPSPDDMEDPATAEVVALLFYDPDGDPHDPDEYFDVVQRFVRTGLRVVRTWQAAGRSDAAVHVAQRLVSALPDHGDVWYVLAESLWQTNDFVPAVHAAMRTHYLDARAPLPDWLPDPDTLRAEVIEALKEAPCEAVRELVERPVPVFVCVHDQPPVEFVLEGVDPRIPVMSLMTREARGERGILMGIAVYRRGLGTSLEVPGDFSPRLRELVYEEVALALGLEDEDRRCLGLAAEGAGAGADDEPPPRCDA